MRARWEEAIPEKRRRQLSNPDDTGATVQDNAVVDAACLRVAAFMRIWAGLAYDDDDDRHQTVAVEGVTVVLQRQNGAAKRASEWKEWKFLVKDLASVTSRNRVKPTTSSPLKPTRQPEGTPPDFDRPKFDRAVPDNAGDTQDRLNTPGG